MLSRALTTPAANASACYRRASLPPAHVSPCRRGERMGFRVVGLQAAMRSGYKFEGDVGSADAAEVERLLCERSDARSDANSSFFLKVNEYMRCYKMEHQKRTGTLDHSK